MATIDVIVPIYNGEKYLETIYSAFKNQTFKDFRVIFVNDGSTDNTQLKLEKLCEIAPFETLIVAQVNKGLPGARNAGIINQQQGEINGYTKAMWTGQTTLQLDKTMEFVAKEKITGLYNMVPDHAVSKYDLLGLFNKYMRNNSIKINLVEGIVVDKSLKRTRFDFDYIIPDYEVMVSEFANWIRQHSELYPQYGG